MFKKGYSYLHQDDIITEELKMHILGRGVSLSSLISITTLIYHKSCDLKSSEKKKIVRKNVNITILSYNVKI